MKDGRVIRLQAQLVGFVPRAQPLLILSRSACVSCGFDVLPRFDPPGSSTNKADEAHGGGEREGNPNIAATLSKTESAVIATPRGRPGLDNRDMTASTRPYATMPWAPQTPVWADDRFASPSLSQDTVGGHRDGDKNDKGIAWASTNQRPSRMEPAQTSLGSVSVPGTPKGAYLQRH